MIEVFNITLNYRKNINFNKNKDNYDIKQIAKELEKFYKENSNY